MAKVHYVECPFCKKEYYIDRILHEAIVSNPMQNLKCPFCKKRFSLNLDKQMAGEGSGF